MSNKLVKEEKVFNKEALLAGGLCALVGVAIGFGITYGVMSQNYTKTSNTTSEQEQVVETTQIEETSQSQEEGVAVETTETVSAPAPYNGKFAEALGELGISLEYSEALSNESTAVYTYTGDYTDNIPDSVQGLGAEITTVPTSVPVADYAENPNATVVDNENGLSYVMYTDENGALCWCYESGIQGGADSGYSGYVYSYTNGYANGKDSGFSYAGLDGDSSVKDIVNVLGTPLYTDVYVVEGGEYIYLTFMSADGVTGTSVGIFEDEAAPNGYYISTVNYWTELSEEEAAPFITEEEVTEDETTGDEAVVEEATEEETSEVTE